MAKQNVAEQETLGEAMNKTELFFERNGRTMSYVFLGLLVLAALVFGYRSLILQPRATKAAEIMCPSASTSSKLPSAPISPITAPNTPKVGELVPAVLKIAEPMRCRSSIP